ncbi:hypothetical protein V2J52_13270 [Georgenia sp. MJ173]|uniref:hypothetical protein n=1 Tax=Georgenia sunbinii TaxID=3117728 RepID=UPI002F264CCA
MSLHDTLGNLGTATGAQVMALWTRWEAGELTEAQFRALAGAVLVRAGARSAALADLALTAALSAARQAVVVPVGLEAAPGVHAAARDAVADTLGSVSYERDAPAAVAVLGSAFAYEQFQRSYGDGMRSHGVSYWQRVPNAGACGVCEDLSEGVVSADIPMWHHKGCMCVAQPITN